MEKLTQYITTNSPGALAKACGISRQYLWKLAKGDSLPRVDVAIRIEDATNGAVPARAWVE